MSMRHRAVLSVQSSGLIFYSWVYQWTNWPTVLSLRLLLKFWLLLKAGNETTCVLAQFGSFLVLVTIAWAHKTEGCVTLERECSSKHGRQEIWPYKWLIKKIIIHPSINYVLNNNPWFCSKYDRACFHSHKVGRPISLGLTLLLSDLVRSTLRAFADVLQWHLHQPAAAGVQLRPCYYLTLTTYMAVEASVLV